MEMQATIKTFMMETSRISLKNSGHPGISLISAMTGHPAQIDQKRPKCGRPRRHGRVDPFWVDSTRGGDFSIGVILLQVASIDDDIYISKHVLFFVLYIYLYTFKT